ncbi:putative RNA-directed DNA polymerase [Helianthus annuus]|nr:putative RNA-directed DNA polymerase [Helianthus annuus]
MMFIPTNQFALMADAGNNTRSNCLWFLDSGCSNHMTGNKDIFIQLDESFKLTVRFGDKKGLSVEGKGKVKIELDNGGYRLLDDVYYASSLEYNLLSVGQLMRKGYSLFFDDGKCVIKNRSTGDTLMIVNVASNNMFLLDASHYDPVTPLKSSPVVDEVSKLWHLRYRHYNSHALKVYIIKEWLLACPV